ncbi:penicillin-binding transpeptidase domain-containing protein [Oscillibacter sp.]|uniref:penicillin-binding transpeptidase domain-containing protein n=1 Tax=Oscillibacter sp. TaxID=1945593 RepID=UPI003392CB22
MIETKSNSNRRLFVLIGFLLCVLTSYICVMYDTQINRGDYYREQSVRTITSTETVEASRGILTDRNGQVLVSNRQTYALTFDVSLLSSEDDENTAILRLIQLCRQRGVIWNDNLPMTQTAPYAFAVDAAGAVQRDRFSKFLQTSLKALSTNVKYENVTDALLSSILSPSDLMKQMRTFFGIPEDWSDGDARAVVGVRYELEVRKIINTTAYVFAEDVDTELISLVKDGDYRGAKVSASSVREYDTAAAAHVLGTVGRINEQELAANPDVYNGEDWIGKSGVELAFENYLRGTDGKRLISSNSEGKITSEIYTTEPKPGNTVALTLDLDLQEAAEQALANTVTNMNKDGNTTRGAGAAVVEVGTGEVLALASYPTFDLSSYGTAFTALSQDPANPLFNRATQGTYAPGSTFKPCTAVAGLEEGVITTTTKIRDTGKWYYPGASTGDYFWCWKHSGHGLLNVSQAITNSCNYFFGQVGYMLGLDKLNEYASAFGLGKKTGIEIGDKAGTLATEEQGQDLAPWAAFGQASYSATPLQLANYIATLVDGGGHYDAHLLKSAKTYNNDQVVYLDTPKPSNSLSISDSTLTAVKIGMHDLTTSGALAPYFKSCVVEAGAKTGTAQISSQKVNNGVFVCFAPFDDPKIAVAIVIEKGGSGAALASTAVDILNAYFTKEEIGTVILGENQLLP